MNLYEMLRQFADTWGLVALALAFLAVILWVFRPGSRRIYQSQADIPFKNDRDEGAHRE